MQNWKRLLVLVAFTAAIGVASFAAEEEVNAQTAGSGPTPTAGTSSGGSTSTPPSTAGSGTTTPSTTSEEKKESGGGCSVVAPASNAGIGALVGLALGLAFWRRRKHS